MILGIATIKLAFLYYGLYLNFAPEDFSVYYASGFLLRHGVNPYMADLAATAHRLGLETGYISQATDPPTFLLMFEPLTLMPVHESYWVWQAINLAAFVVALVLLFAPKFSGLPRPLAMTLTGLAMVYAPVGNNFAIAQNKILVLLLLVAMYRCMERRYDGWAGIFLAIAGLMRVFPLLLIFYLAFRSRWRVLGFLAGGLIAGGMITLGLLGIRNGIGFVNTGVSFLTQQRWYSNSANIAIAAVVSRAFWYFGDASLGAGLDVARRVAIAMADLGVVLALISATPARNEEDPDWRILLLHEIDERWRIIATLNSRDRDLLFNMSYALIRRFAIVDIPNPLPAVSISILAEKASSGDNELDAAIAALINCRIARSRLRSSLTADAISQQDAWWPRSVPAS